jgi:hypothetical protein
LSFATENLPKYTLALNRGSILYYPPKYQFLGGVLIPIMRKNNITKLRSFTNIYVYPNVRVLINGNYDLITLSNLFYRKPFIAGIGWQTFKTIDLRSKNQTMLTLGYDGLAFQNLKIQFLYSFDMGLSIAGNRPLFMTHEFSLAFNFVNSRRSDCPKKLNYNIKRWFSKEDLNSWHNGECPPGKTKVRGVDDVFPMFYPVELPKPYLPNELNIF